MLSDMMRRTPQTFARDPSNSPVLPLFHVDQQLFSTAPTTFSCSQTYFLASCPNPLLPAPPVSILVPPYAAPQEDHLCPAGGTAQPLLE